jgi:hypothetical protein
MKSRVTNLRKAKAYHGTTRDLLNQMGEKTAVDEMIVRIDGMGCRAKKIEVAALEGNIVHQGQLGNVMSELELAREDLKKLLEEKLEVQDLLARVDDQIVALENLVVEPQNEESAEPQIVEPWMEAFQTVEPHHQIRRKWRREEHRRPTSRKSSGCYVGV